MRNKKFADPCSRNKNNYNIRGAQRGFSVLLGSLKLYFSRLPIPRQKARNYILSQYPSYLQSLGLGHLSLNQLLDLNSFLTTLAFYSEQHWLSCYPRRMPYLYSLQDFSTAWNTLPLCLYMDGSLSFNYPLKCHSFREVLSDHLICNGPHTSLLSKSLCSFIFSLHESPSGIILSAFLLIYCLFPPLGCLLQHPEQCSAHKRLQYLLMVAVEMLCYEEKLICNSKTAIEPRFRFRNLFILMQINV